MKSIDEILQNPEAKKFLGQIGISEAEIRLYYSFYQKKITSTSTQTITVSETESQKQYISSSGVPTKYLIPATFLNSQKKAFETLNNFLGNQSLDNFLMNELKYKSVKELDNSIMPVQKDAVALFIKNFRG
jgi:hypothetical protein